MALSFLFVGHAVSVGRSERSERRVGYYVPVKRVKVMCYKCFGN